MRIGTWNLAGGGSASHVTALEGLDCEVLLLTEVGVDLALSAYDVVHSRERMGEWKWWSAVAVRSGRQAQAPAPHLVAAAAAVDGITFWSMVLPWRGAGPYWRWAGDDHAGRTRAAVQALLDVERPRRLVWGGDWNHALVGPELAGSRDGRRAVEDAVRELELVVPTAPLAHRRPGFTIDHIAVPQDAPVSAVWRERLTVGDRDLSDHDAYVVEVDLVDGDLSSS